MTRKSLHTGLLLLLASTAVPALHAGMYRWIDDQGNVVYSQQPPPDNRDTKVIAPPPPPAEDSENNLNQARELNKKLDALAQERQKAQKKKQVTKEGQKQLEERCKAAKNNLKTLTERPPNTLYRLPNGEYKRFTEEERTQQIDTMKKVIQESCKQKKR